MKGKILMVMALFVLALCGAQAASSWPVSEPSPSVPAAPTAPTAPAASDVTASGGGAPSGAVATATQVTKADDSGGSSDDTPPCIVALYGPSDVTVGNGAFPDGDQDGVAATASIECGEDSPWATPGARIYYSLVCVGGDGATDTGVPKSRVDAWIAKHGCSSATLGDAPASLDDLG